MLKYAPGRSNRIYSISDDIISSLSEELMLQQQTALPKGHPASHRESYRSNAFRRILVSPLWYVTEKLA